MIELGGVVGATLTGRPPLDRPISDVRGAPTDTYSYNTEHRGVTNMDVKRFGVIDGGAIYIIITALHCVIIIIGEIAV